ncbi:unnamed protein product [Nezara viridula]|uniref:Uncharacterized protein n=1 Tax=Nezara viridula TaxID=85310 RepID=A0A9P0E264_NEZVI|nr:unnamed protein product [Nezara viridula]
MNLTVFTPTIPPISSSLIPSNSLMPYSSPTPSTSSLSSSSSSLPIFPPPSNPPSPSSYSLSNILPHPPIRTSRSSTPTPLPPAEQLADGGRVIFSGLLYVDTGQTDVDGYKPQSNKKERKKQLTTD